jgi:hypothetical protein
MIVISDSDLACVRYHVLVYHVRMCRDLMGPLAKYESSRLHKILVDPPVTLISSTTLALLLPYFAAIFAFASPKLLKISVVVRSLP